MGKFCKYCGSELNDGSKFCPKCGAKIEEIIENNDPIKTVENGLNNNPVNNNQTNEN